MKVSVRAMMKASEYFNIPVEELRVDCDGIHQNGDLLVLENSTISRPFYTDLTLAMEATSHYSKNWNYYNVQLIETDYSDKYKYAIIAS